MESPLRIFFVGNSPQGGKLRVHFEGKDLPTAIKVKGTNDQQPVKLRKNNKGIVSGRWTSKAKYPSRLLTLQLIQCGRVVAESKYDSCGDIVIENPNVTINATSSITATNGTVTFAWTSILEDAVDQYTSEKKVQGATAWEAFDADEPTGKGSTYYSTDVPVASATIDYRLKSIFTDGSEKVLLNQTLSVVVPSVAKVTIQNFAAEFNPNSGLIAVSWKSIDEVSLLGYTLQLKGASEPDFVDMLNVDPTGSGSSYNFSAFADAGDYTLRLRGNLVNATEPIVLAEQPVAIPVA